MRRCHRRGRFDSLTMYAEASGLSWSSVSPFSRGGRTLKWTGYASMPHRTNPDLNPAVVECMETRSSDKGDASVTGDGEGTVPARGVGVALGVGRYHMPPRPTVYCGPISSHSSDLRSGEDASVFLEAVPVYSSRQLICPFIVVLVSRSPWSTVARWCGEVRRPLDH